MLGAASVWAASDVPTLGAATRREGGARHAEARGCDLRGFGSGRDAGLELDQGGRKLGGVRKRGREEARRLCDPGSAAVGTQAWRSSREGQR